jgi:hypothetical protein
MNKAGRLKTEFMKTNLPPYDNNFPFHELNFFSKFSSIITYSFMVHRDSQISKGIFAQTTTE